MTNPVKSIFILLIGAILFMNQDASAAESKDQIKATATQKAYFAAGCFWKVQYIFSKVPGVIRTRAGYSGGHSPSPTYKEVCSDKSGHAETVQVEFDPSKVTYHKLLEVFFANHDPTTLNRQGPDIGTQYRSAIFYSNPEQEKEAISYKNELNKAHKFRSPVVTEIKEAGAFTDAEEYHQDYFIKHGAVCH
ncbi:MAG: peptide-methionine (S)-S-oxide reductase MsrA [Candidatus Obscuribacterales bacterium]|nr:peptide-methionine (S)-S-oxide reductase MsrA [Candidatus Obscuribacterales bacterium]